MPQFVKLTLYNEINLSVRFQDYFSHVWEDSRLIIQTVIKQTKKSSLIKVIIIIIIIIYISKVLKL